MKPNFDIILNRLKRESEQDINWTLDLDCFILQIISIPASNWIWVIASEENIFLVDTEKGEIVKEFRAIAEFIFSAVIHPKTNDLFIASSNGVFLLTTHESKRVLIDEKDWFEHIAISSDGSVIFVAKGRALYILEQNRDAYELLSKDDSFESTISDIIFNIDSFLVSNYGSVREYKTKDFEDYQLFKWKTSLLTTSWSTDKKYIVAGTQENIIHFWPYPFEEEKDFQISGYQSKVTKMIWTNDASEFVVNCSEDVQIWDFSDGPPTGKSPVMLKCGYGKITDIHYKGNLLIATSEKGLIFYFLPTDTDKYVQMHSVGAKISCISVNDDESEVYVGSKSGMLYGLEIVI